MEGLWWAIIHTLSFVWAVLVWLVGTLFWFGVWVLLPIAVIGFIALRVAEHIIGQEHVRSWVTRQSLKFGIAAGHRARRVLFALGALPLRVLGWFMIYTIWHSVVSLLWRPRWSPWQRAWSRRWRKQSH